MTDQTSLVAVLLDRPAAAATIRTAWERGEAVAVLDPTAPPAVLDALLSLVRPTHVVDADGRRRRDDGVPVPDDVRAVVLSSGTTAGPKAVELTAAGLHAAGAGCNAALDVAADDRWLVCLPLHHVAGLAILARAAVGGQAVTVHPSFDTDAVATAPRREATTLVSVVPTMLGRLLEAGAPLHEYRRVVVGGAPLAPALRRRAETAGVPVVDAYGLSETWGGFVLDGHPMPGAEVDVGPDGEIRARGPMILRGYRFDPGATDAALDAEGWFRTGDVGDWGADRRLRVVDRRRDLVITGGVNVSPTTVETVLAGHPDVADVCVTGAPDLDWGERVVAFVVPRAGRSVPTVEDLRSFGRDRLRAAELPRQVVDVDAIPRTAGGKAQRRRLPLPDEPAVPSTGVARDPLAEYVAKRDFVHTPEPGTEATGLARPGELRFVVQEHHARRLHWDLRLEHDGVLWSWAVPKGIPMRPKPNHLAVRTEDHPLPYLSFEGEIPAGQYGAGTMTVWDHGTYEPEKVRPDELIVTFHGARVRGTYALFQTRDDQWMLHRMSPPEDPTRTSIPTSLAPMLAVAGTLPADDDEWGYEMKWDGMRVLAAVEGGRVRLTSRRGNDVTQRFPELRGLGAAMGAREAVLDGEVVALDDTGRPSFERLQPRMQVGSPAKARQLAGHNPVALMLFDVLWLDGRLAIARPYRERRELLEGLELAGPHWQTPPTTYGGGGRVLATAEELGLEGVLAKRVDRPYRPGERSDAWRKVKVTAGQELVVGGWLRGNGRLAGRLGSLLVGYHDEPGGPLRYAGRVGSGIDESTRAGLEATLAPLRRDRAPFVDAPRLPDPVWTEPELVAEVGFHEWTSAGLLRAPRFRGIRDDQDPGDVVREPT